MYEYYLKPEVIRLHLFVYLSTSYIYILEKYCICKIHIRVIDYAGKLFWGE